MRPAAQRLSSITGVLALLVGLVFARGDDFLDTESAPAVGGELEVLANEDLVGLLHQRGEEAEKVREYAARTRVLSDLVVSAQHEGMAGGERCSKLQRGSGRWWRS